jgi:hypothetical protein
MKSPLRAGVRPLGSPSASTIALLAGWIAAALAVRVQAADAYIRVRDATYDIRHLPVLDASGQPTRFALVVGAGGEPQQIKHVWGPRGEFTVYPVEADAEGAVMFARGPDAGAATFQPFGNPAQLKQRLPSSHLGEPNRTYYPVETEASPGPARASPGLLAEPGTISAKGVRIGAAPGAVAGPGRGPPPGARIQPTLPESREPGAVAKESPGLLAEPGTVSPKGVPLGVSARVIPAGAEPTVGRAKVPVPPAGDRVEIDGTPWICGKPPRPTRPARRILDSGSGHPAEALAVEAFICGKGVQNPGLREQLDPFLRQRGLAPEQSEALVSGLARLEKTSSPDQPTDVQAFICKLGVPPAQADEIVEFICTKGPRPQDKQEITAFICQLGASPAVAERQLESWCGTRFDAGQAAGRVEEICVLRRLPETLRDDWIQGCVMRVSEAGLTPADVQVGWQMACAGYTLDPVVQAEVSAALPSFCGTNWANAPAPVSKGLPRQAEVRPPAPVIAVRPRYNPLDDPGDAAGVPANNPAWADVFAQLGQARADLSQGRAVSGDDGGAQIEPLPVIGANVAATERTLRDGFAQRPGAHANDPEAGMATGNPDPLGQLNDAVSAVAGAVAGVQGAVAGVRDIDQQIERLRDDFGGGNDDDGPRPAPELARPTGSAPAPHGGAVTPGKPGRPPHAGGKPISPSAAARPPSPGQSPAPGGGHGKPGPKPSHPHPQEVEGEVETFRPPTPVDVGGLTGYLVCLQSGNFLGAGPAENYNSRKRNLEAQGKTMDWKIIQSGFTSSAAAHRWILDHTQPAESNSPYMEARIFRGQRVTVRANLESFAR